MGNLKSLLISAVAWETTPWRWRSPNLTLGYLPLMFILQASAKWRKLRMKNSLTNILIHHGDGIDVMRDWLLPNSIAEVHILFPDPWPKIRHNKRRLIQQDFLNLVSKALQPNGLVRFVTDDVSYFEHAKLSV